MKGSEDFADPWIETFSGHEFYIQTPAFDLKDIIHAAALTCRWGGHCRIFFSVAEHEVIVARLMENLFGGDPLEGLFHDGTESYLSDVPSPFKQLLPDWRWIDKELETKMRIYLELPADRTDECLKADWTALFMEAIFLMPSKGTKYPDPYDLRPVAMNLMKHQSFYPDLKFPTGFMSTAAEDNFHAEHIRLDALKRLRKTIREITSV